MDGFVWYEVLFYLVDGLGCVVCFVYGRFCCIVVYMFLCSEGLFGLVVGMFFDDFVVFYGLYVCYFMVDDG